MNKNRYVGLFVDGAVLLLALLTWYAFTHVDAYRDTGAELLRNPTFRTGLAGLHASKGLPPQQDGSADLSSHQTQSTHIISQVISRPESGMLRLSVDARIKNVHRGASDWQTAHVDLLGLDATGHWQWNFDHTLFSAIGTHEFNGFSRVLHIPARFSKVQVEAEFTGAVGTFILHRLSAHAVIARPWVALFKYTLAAAWVVMITLVVIGLARSRSWRTFFALVPGGLIILFLPGDFRRWIEALFTVPGLRLSLDHLFLFLVMTVLALGGPDRRLKLAPLLHLAVMGFAIEAVQYYLPGRTSDLTDAISDLLGITFGAIFYVTTIRLSVVQKVYDRTQL